MEEQNQTQGQSQAKRLENLKKAREARAKKLEEMKAQKTEELEMVGDRKEAQEESQERVKKVKEMTPVEQAESHLKAGSIPGFEPGQPLNMFQVRDYLMTQGNPLAAFQKLIKNGVISQKLEHGVRLEMRRNGFQEF